MLVVLSWRYLGWKEDIFWKETPRRYSALIAAALEHESAKWGGGKDKKGTKQGQSTTTSIENIPGW